MLRLGRMIGLHPQFEDHYRHAHANPWPEVNAMLKACHFQNYTIFLRKPENLMFAYSEYTGSDLAADRAAMQAHAPTQEWLNAMRPCQKPLASAAPGEWWSPMEPIFRLD